MAKSKAATPEDYIAELPRERGAIIAALRDLIRRNIPKGYAETMNWGMLSYEIPLERYPNTYNGQPLSFVSLAAQKNHFALYLMCIYMCEEKQIELRAAFKKAGKKLDMGKSCVRFKKLDDLALEPLAKIIASVSVDKYIARYESARASMNSTAARRCT